MTLGFSPGVWKLGHLLCKYQIIAKQWPVTNRSSPMNMRVRRRFRPLWDCLAMSGAYLNHGRCLAPAKKAGLPPYAASGAIRRLLNAGINKCVELVPPPTPILANNDAGPGAPGAP